MRKPRTKDWTTDGTQKMRANAGIKIPTTTRKSQQSTDARLLDALECSLGPQPDSILSRELDVGCLELGEIIDVQMMQSLLEHLDDLAHMPMAIIDAKGKLLVVVGWQEICMRFHRVHPDTCKNCLEGKTHLTADIAAGEFKLYKCKNNLWHVATPILVGERHLGNLLSGQFFLEGEPVDYEFFRAQAKQCGFDEMEYLAATEAVPRLSREVVNTGMAFLVKLAQMLSQMGYNNIRLARSVEATKQAQARTAERETWFRTLFETIPLSVTLIDPRSRRLLQFNDAAAKDLGYTREEFAKLTIDDIDAVHSPQQLDEHFAERSRSGDFAVFERKHRTNLARFGMSWYTAAI